MTFRCYFYVIMQKSLYIKFLYKRPMVFWLLVFLFYFIIWAQLSLYRAIIVSILLTLSQIIIVYVNQKKLLPNFFDTQRKKYINYVFYLLLIVVICSVSIERELIPFFNLTGRYELPPLYFVIFQHSLVDLIAFWISTSLYLLNKEEQNKIKIEELKKQRIETELKLLKSQINPHFLFNALNNIYAISYTGDPTTPDKILMLSNMLRYVLYDCTSDYVKLNDELDYISDYIEFQQLKTEHKQNIKFCVDIKDEDYKISPMLLIPLVENSFKYSKIDKDEKGFVKIDMRQLDNRLNFKITNSIPSVPAAKNVIADGGIGLDNVRKRLDLIYHSHYSLHVDNTVNEFKVELTIDNGKQQQ